MAVAELYPVLKISLCDQRPSGYVREDTIGTKNPIQKTCADSFYIPEKGGEGIRYMQIDENRKRKEIPRFEALRILNEKSEGYENIIPERYAIRYIKGCPEISVEWQKENKWEPNTDPFSDSILIEEGYAEFDYNNDPVKYRYVSELMWFKDLPHRLEHIKPMYYEIKEDKKAALNIDVILARDAAMDEWKLLVNKTKDGFTINEEKLNGYCQLMNVQGNNATERLGNLHTKLTANPMEFIEKVTAYKEETVTDISHAMQLDLIKFEGNSAVLTYNNKRIELGKSPNKTTKIERLAEMLKTPEYKEHYVMLKNQIQIAKEKQLN